MVVDDKHCPQQHTAPGADIFVGIREDAQRLNRTDEMVDDRACVTTTRLASVVPLCHSCLAEEAMLQIIHPMMLMMLMMMMNRMKVQHIRLEVLLVPKFS